MLKLSLFQIPISVHDNTDKTCITSLEEGKNSLKHFEYKIKNE